MKKHFSTAFFLAAFLIIFALPAKAASVGECVLVETNVSQDTSRAERQCETAAFPFCSIAQGVSVVL